MPCRSAHAGEAENPGLRRQFPLTLAIPSGSRQYGGAELGGGLRGNRITFVIGTRPEAIKLAPVARALKARDLAPRLLLTGQHPELNPTEHGLGGNDIVQLKCVGLEDPHAHVEAVARSAVPVLRGGSLVVVQGDTSSALAGALAAAEVGAPIAHVEAGLRTHDLSKPWPEEKFRIAIDAEADLLFAPTLLSANNLRRERVSGQIYVTGNTGIDVVLEAAAKLPPATKRRSSKARLLVTCHRRESWGDALAGIAAALKTIARTGMSEIRFVLHPNPIVASDMRRLLEGARAIELRPPCGHLEMLQLMRDSDLILSDSGGMQEEAPALGVPLLVLRERTERPEGIATGSMALVGREPGRIVSTVLRLLAEPESLAAMRMPTLPYGDGRASERIASAIAAWLSGEDLSPARPGQNVQPDQVITRVNA